MFPNRIIRVTFSNITHANFEGDQPARRRQTNTQALKRTTIHGRYLRVLFGVGLSQ